MFSLRRATRAYNGLTRVRYNVTVASTQSVEPTLAPAPPPPPAKKAEAAEALANSAQASSKEDKPSTATRKRGRAGPTGRPLINLERPRQYSRPIGVGVLPVYDQALGYIKRDSKLRKAELEEYRALLKKAESTPDWNQDDLEKLKEKIRILEVQSEINLPSVRWKARNGMADMSQPVYRHLVEQRWREDGPLDMLMERIYQMGVVPDMMPEMHPSFDLRVNFPEPPPQDPVRRARVKRKYEKIEPGVFLLPEQTRRPPMLYTTVFHTDPRLYTLLMVDLDVPNPDDQAFQTYLHWLQPNISLSAFSESPIPITTSHTKYVPPHPQKGTNYHRYALLLVPQSHPTEKVTIPVPTEEERLGFNYRAFSEFYGLDAGKGGGAFMWREVWDETVSQIYRDTLKKEEPVFGRSPKPDPYAEVKQTKKYIL
ncbi:hypothetical protein QCA50_008481 [Cerrena zonata]|uniref:PEBP-like protein n=1 Tax=Cerrena zonata TaxID=2478898 RepID=A0AAW0GET1_9APHY